MIPLAISLFSGCGGCSLGLKDAGYQVTLAVDNNEDACTTYTDNLRSENVRCEDLSKCTPLDILQWSELQRSELDLIVGGPPCQGFSSAGVKDWRDPRNSLLREFVEIVVDLKPTWFIMENVEGLLTARDGFFIVEAISRFLEAGYWVRAKKVYMEQYGIPQKRKRVLVVGNLEQCFFNFPEPTCCADDALPFFGGASQLSILDAIGDLPEPTENIESFISYRCKPVNDFQRRMQRSDGKPVLQHNLKQLNDISYQRVQQLKQGQTMKNLPNYLQHPSFQKRAFRRVMDGTPTEKRGGAPSGMKRLIASTPSLTITSASPTEFVHPTQDRLLTLRECARIQTFPDRFQCSGNWSSVATQIGNAIPPLFMSLLSNHILSLAFWQRKQSSQGRWLGMEATKSNGMSPALSTMLASLEERTYAYTE